MFFIHFHWDHKHICALYLRKAVLVLKVGQSQGFEQILQNVSNQPSSHHLIFWPNSRNLSSCCRHHPETGFYYFLLSHHRVQLDHKAYLQWSIIVVTKVICSTLFCYSCCESQTSLEKKIFFFVLCAERLSLSCDMMVHLFDNAIIFHLQKTINS